MVLENSEKKKSYISESDKIFEDWLTQCTTYTVDIYTNVTSLLERETVGDKANRAIHLKDRFSSIVL